MPAQTPALGEGRLTLGRVAGHAVGMLRYGFRRIALVAVILFLPPSLLSALVAHVLLDFERDPEALVGLGVVVSVAVAASFRLLGPVVFAGYLDEAVGRGYFQGAQNHLPDVLRTLPWGRLLVADLLVMGGTALLALAFILPGLAFYMLVGLVGPVLVQERRGLRASFARTYRLSLGALRLVAMLVLVPTIFELTLHEIVFGALHGSLVAELAAEWFLGAVIGGSLGLLEVALATELMARHPLPTDR